MKFIFSKYNGKFHCQPLFQTLFIYSIFFRFTINLLIEICVYKGYKGKVTAITIVGNIQWNTKRKKLQKYLTSLFFCRRKLRGCICKKKVYTKIVDYVTSTYNWYTGIVIVILLEIYRQFFEKTSTLFFYWIDSIWYQYQFDINNICYCFKDEKQ